MKRQLTYRIVVVLLTVGLVQWAVGGPFTGSTDERNRKKLSLKHLSVYRQGSSYANPGYSLKFKGSQTLQVQTSQSGVQVNNLIKYENGNTTYVYPYKYKMKTPKIINPAARQ
jgi:hypothetical protein